MKIRSEQMAHLDTLNVPQPPNTVIVRIASGEVKFEVRNHRDEFPTKCKKGTGDGRHGLWKSKPDGEEPC